MRTKILRNIIISVGAFFAFTRLLTAGTSDGVPNFNDGLLRPQPTFVTFDVPDAAKGTFPVGINPGGASQEPILTQAL